MAGQSVDYNSNDAPAKAKSGPTAEQLFAYIQSPNIAVELEPEQLGKISAKAIRGYRIDKRSCEAWLERNKAGIELATLVSEGDKDYPFPGASNIKYPLITVGALQFNARAYPALIPNERVCKAKVNGHDQDGQKAARAERVSEHSSYQMLTEMPEWHEDTDKLTIILPITGSMFRKRYYDPTLARQCSRLLTPDRLVMNYYARSLEDVPRISERLSLYPYEIEERIRDGRFVAFSYGQAQPDPEDNADKIDAGDEDAPHEFIEQHGMFDLDDDGYPEPYIVTVHLATEQVCRIVANFDHQSVRVTQGGKVAAIRKRDYYVKYLFFPSPDGGAYGMGFGSLLKSTNEAINTTMNEMLDSGHLSNLQAGFISATAGLREKHITLQKGTFRVLQTNVPINQAVLPVKFDGPSDVLFKLLGLLIEQGKEVSGTKDVLTGDTGGKVLQPTTTLALIEQGMKVFNAIFKRIFRSMGRELELHADLNADYLSPEIYNAYWDGPEQYDPKADYDLGDMNITPVSDPSLSTQMQRLATAQVTREIGQGKPWINQMELDRRSFEAVGTPEIDKLFVPPPQPDPTMEAFKQAMQSMTLLDLKTRIEKQETAALLDVANAEKADGANALSAYDFFLRSLQAQHGMEQSIASQNAAPASGPGGLPGMEGQQPDAMGAGAPPGPMPGDGATGPGPALGPVGGPSQPMGGEPSPGGAPAGPG